MTERSKDRSAMVIVKHQMSQTRGAIWRVCVFINGERLIRPGFHQRKAAINLAAMHVQQMLVNGWKVVWNVTDERGHAVDLNLAALGSKMQRGENRRHSEKKRQRQAMIVLPSNKEQGDIKKKS